MKKRSIRVLFLSLCLALAAAVGTGSAFAAEPVMTLDPLAGFTTVTAGKTGTRYVEETDSVEIYVTLNQNQPRVTSQFNYDLRDITMEIDVSGISEGYSAFFFLSSGPNPNTSPYAVNKPGVALTIRKAKGATDGYIVIVSNVYTNASGAEGHNKGMTDALKEYSDADSFSGLDFTGLGGEKDRGAVPDGKFTVSYKKEGENYTVTINEEEPIVIPVATFEKSLNRESIAEDVRGNLNLGIGIFGADSTAQTVVFSSSDTNSRAYYASDLYTQTKTAVEAYVAAANGDLSTATLINEAKAKKTFNLSDTGLRVTDRNRWNPQVSAADALIEAAEASLSESEIIEVIEAAVQKYEEAVASLDANPTVAGINAAKQAKAGISYGENTGDAVDALKEREQAADAKLQVAIDAVAENLVAAYETAAENLTDLDAILSAKQAKNAIPTSFIEEASESNRADLNARVAAADALVAAANGVEGWTLTNASDIAVAGESDFTVRFEPGGLIAYDEKLGVTNFTLDLSIEEWHSTGWLAITLMKEKARFSEIADTLTDNPGIVFLCRFSNNSVEVEVYVIKLTSTAFLSSKRGSVSAPFTDGKLRIEVLTNKNDDNALDLSVNGSPVNVSSALKVTECKGMFGSELTGYPVICSMGNPGGVYRFAVEKVNEKNATADDLAYVPEESGDNTGDGDNNQGGDGKPGGCGSIGSDGGSSMSRLLGFGAILLAVSVIFLHRKGKE